MLTMKKVPMLGGTTRNVKRLYETAFPVEQRVPFWSLRLRSNMNGMEIVAYYDEDVFCGFRMPARNGKCGLSVLHRRCR